MCDHPPTARAPWHSVRQASAVPDDPAGYSLVHPVYLDVPMMVSFLAHLEGGVSTQEEETKKEVGARERALKGRAGLRLRLPLALEADAGSEGSSQRRDESSLESKTERHHTAASLFNLLYEYLKEDKQVASLDEPSQLEELGTGQLVEVAGEYVGNPLEDILALLGALLPYLTEQQRTQQAAAASALERSRKSQKSGSGQKRSGVQTPDADLADALAGMLQQSQDAQTEFGIAMLLRMVEDIQKVPVHDLLLKTRTGLQVVLTVASDYYSSATNEYLRAGEFRVVGKVTRVITGAGTINLTRRTVLGVAGPTTARELISSFDSGEFNLELADPIVSAPAVQILPMAIFL